MLILKIFLSALLLVTLRVVTISQVKIGDNPTSLNINSVLELESTNKGLLIPRVALVSTITPVPLSAHVAGMNVYNTATIGDVAPGNYYNNGTKWIKVADAANGNHYQSTEANIPLTTSSLIDVVMPGMTLSPPSGTYLVLFNGQFLTTAGTTTTTSSSFTSAQGCLDVATIASQIRSMSVTDASHSPVFGMGETLTTGYYKVVPALAQNGLLILDGGGDPDALFIFESVGAINSQIAAEVRLINGASANNIFWIGAGIGTGADSKMYGTLLSSPGAASIGANGVLVGRLLSTAGALSGNMGIMSIPTPTTSKHIDMLSLKTFMAFTCAGAVAFTGATMLTGDISSDFGAIAPFPVTGTLIGTIYPASSTVTPPTTTTTITKTIASFSIYKNGIMLPNSTRTTTSDNGQISLQSVATVVAGQAIDIRYNIDVGPLTVGNRILTLVNVR